jgi:sulfite exporter TauE/SafE
MTPLALLGSTALALGALHSFAPDHLAAVSVFVSRRPHWRRAASLGARWALGHSATVLLVGGGLALSGVRLPERLTPLAEHAVGATLIVLGVLAVARAVRLHGHWHRHGEVRHWHLHAHASGSAATNGNSAHRIQGAHDHSHAALFGIGMLHGLAGSGALVIALPAAVATSPTRSILFLACFGAGTVVAMSLFSGAAGLLLGAATRRWVALHKAAAVLAGVTSALVGVWWLWAAVR